MPKTVTTYTDEELGLAEGWDEQLDPNIKEMRRHAKVTERENRELRRELEERKRIDSFASAGVKNDARGQAFAKLYDGDGSPEDVKERYEELFGPISDESSNSGAADTSADQRIAEATNAGSSQGTPGTVDLAEAIRSAKTTAEVLEIVRHAPPEAKIRLPED